MLHVAALEPEGVREGHVLPDQLPVLLVVQVTDPVGFVGLELVSVIVTVQLSVLLIDKDEETHEAVVVYERKPVHAEPQGIGVGARVVRMPVK